MQRLPVQLLNWIAGKGGVAARVDLSEEGLCRAACNRTGLADFDGDEFRTPLRILLRALAEEARLHHFGRLHARRVVLRCLVNRLRLAADWNRRPDVLREEIRAPLFVLGLPRSGTTLMLNLLAADPAHRWLGFWEAHDPSPPSRGAHDSRRRRARVELRALDYLAPDLMAMHEMSADGPEECFPLLANSFAGVLFSWMFEVPSFDDWLSGHDMRTAYAYYRRQLQLLQWHRPAETWVLKSPAHLWTVDALLTTFPDARIIQLHRDPLRVVPSACSLGATMRSLATSDVDLHRLGRRTTEALAAGVDRCRRARVARAPQHWIDLQYVDFVRDPLGTLRAIYDRFGMPFTPAAAAGAAACLARHPQHKRGVHRYTLGQFGLSAAEERRRYAAYCETHHVRPES